MQAADASTAVTWEGVEIHQRGLPYHGYYWVYKLHLTCLQEGKCAKVKIRTPLGKVKSGGSGSKINAFSGKGRRRGQRSCWSTSSPENKNPDSSLRSPSTIHPLHVILRLSLR